MPAESTRSFWTPARVASALGGGPCDDRPIHAVCTDTRAIVRGDPFVALKGENHDAHLFLAEAVAKGAAAVVVDDGGARRSWAFPCTSWPNTARRARRAWSRRCRAWGGLDVAVGGSNGKTSTKELI